MDVPPLAAARLGPVVLLCEPLAPAEGLPAFLLRGDAREPALVDLLYLPDAPGDELALVTGVAARMPPDALAAAVAGGVQHRATIHGFVARRWLPGVYGTELLRRLGDVPGSLDASIAAHLGAVMLRSLAAVPPALHATLGELVVGWDGRVACRDPSPALDFGSAMHRARWLSPEVILGASLTTASRVHEVAASVFALLTGRHFVPLTDGDNTATLLAVLREPRTPVGRLRPDLDVGLARAIDAALAIDAAARPSPEALGAALARAAAGATASSVAALVAGLFPREREASLAWWDDARGLDVASAPALPVSAPPPPAADLAAAVRRLLDHRMRLT